MLQMSVFHNKPFAEVRLSIGTYSYLSLSAFKTIRGHDSPGASSQGFPQPMLKLGPANCTLETLFTNTLVHSCPTGKQTGHYWLAKTDTMFTLCLQKLRRHYQREHECLCSSYECEIARMPFRRVYDSSSASLGSHILGL